jgi:hypothetical protein
MKISKFRCGNFRLSLKIEIRDVTVRQDVVSETPEDGLMKQGNVCSARDVDRDATQIDSSLHRMKMEQDGQYTYDVTLRRVRVATVVVEKQQCVLCFFTLSHKRHDFGKANIVHKIVF